MGVKITTPYIPFEHFIFRTPLFPFEFLSNEDDFMKYNVFLEALFIASPELSEEISKLQNTPDITHKEKERIAGSLYRYYQRACNRPTPFGYYPNRIRLAKERIPLQEEQYRSLLRQQKITEEQTSLIDRNYERTSSMHEQGGISGRELDESRSRQLQGQLSEENMLNAINNMRMQLAQLHESIIDMEYQHTERMNEFRSQIRSMVSQLKAGIQSWEMSYVLTSPVDGKITFTRYWVSNQNVQAGEEVFTVVPASESHIIGKAMLPVARSGKVEKDQSVNIRLDNFPDSEFGMLKGVVQNISLVPATSGNATYYVVEIELPEGLNTNYKKELPYLPNMQGMADIITENMSLLERFVMPVKKIFKR